MKMLLTLVTIIMMSSVYAQSTPKYLYEMTLGGMSESYEDLISNVKELKREIKKALPLIGRKNKFRKAACIQIESTVETNLTRLREASIVAPTMDVKDEQVTDLRNALKGL